MHIWPSRSRVIPDEPVTSWSVHASLLKNFVKSVERGNRKWLYLAGGPYLPRHGRQQAVLVFLKQAFRKKNRPRPRRCRCLSTAAYSLGLSLRCSRLTTWIMAVPLCATHERAQQQAAHLWDCKSYGVLATELAFVGIASVRWNSACMPSTKIIQTATDSWF